MTRATRLPFGPSKDTVVLGTQLWLKRLAVGKRAIAAAQLPRARADSRHSAQRLTASVRHAALLLLLLLLLLQLLLLQLLLEQREGQLSVLAGRRRRH